MNCLLLFCLLSPLSVTNQPLMEVDFSTHVYFEGEQDGKPVSLELDFFAAQVPDSVLAPVVIYVHGGGFAVGSREEGHRLGNYLSERGIALASISYSLYMQDKDFSCGGVTSEKIKAIQLAASETWQATHYLMQHAEDFGIDSHRIFLAGSSAGAETVLHAAYWNEADMNYAGSVLAPDFRYAGVVGGAGAIMDLNLITEANAIPFQGFHGSQDPVVPYATAAHHFCPPNATGWLMFFGSFSIHQHLDELGVSSQLISHMRAGHEVAGWYFHDHQEVVYRFIERVLAGEQFVEHRRVDME